jgi:isopenicillin-N epimerase
MNRREVIRNLGLTAALFGLPASAAAGKVQALPSGGMFTEDPEQYWNTLRDDQFVLPGKRAFLNTGSLGVAPRPVLKAVNDYLEHSAALTTEERYPRWGYETLDEYRTAMSAYVGCKKDELAFVHNATEAMAVIAGGMPLEHGDEVLITDQEHPSGRCPWQVREARGEISVREVALPMPPDNPQQLLDVVVSAIGPKTRVLSFSGITSPTGLLMPIREICDAARERGVITACIAIITPAARTSGCSRRRDPDSCISTKSGSTITIPSSPPPAGMTNRSKQGASCASARTTGRYSSA